ncbi:hypothetical protein HN713_01990 [bacterium]|nr:hypothetical protein [bacterium]
MDFIKISLEPDDGVAQILKVLSRAEHDKIVFLCGRNSGVFADRSVVKKFAETAEKCGKKIIFITSHRFVCRLLKMSEFETYEHLPEEFVSENPLTIAQFLSGENFSTTKKSHCSEKPKVDFSPHFQTHEISRTPFFKKWRSSMFFLFLILVAAIGGIWWWSQPRATIVVKPRISAEPVIQNVLIVFPDAKIPERDSELPQIQGIFVETEVVGTETFPASGRKYDITNARGRVTLFNEMRVPKRLVPSRLSDADGSIFRFLSEVVIPPATDSGPGTLEVSVVADEFDEHDFPIGTRGNISAGTELFFPALRDELRELFYARANRGAFSGGLTVTHFLPQDEDKIAAREFLTESFRTQAVRQLQDEIKNRSAREKKKYVFLDEPHLIRPVFSEYQFPDEVLGTETQTFEVSGKLNLYGIVFDQDMIAEVLLGKLKAKLDERQRLVQIDNNSAEYQVLEFEKLEEQGWIKLSVKMTGVKTLDLQSTDPEERRWRQNLQKQLSGLSTESAHSILLNIPEIEQVRDVTLFPWWRKTLPSNFEKIELTTISR